MNALPEPNARVRPHADRGFTLIELIIALTLSLLIGGVVVAALITSLNVSSSTSDQISDSADAGLLTSFLTRDAQSSGAIVPTTAARDTTVGVSTSDWGGCTQAPPLSLVVRFSWIEHTTALLQSRVVVTYAIDATNAQLTRRVCRDSSTGVDVILARHLAAAVATCDTTNCSGTPVSVSLTVTGSATRAPFAYTLKASLRGDTQAAPTVTNSTPVPLLALGSGAAAVCPNVDIAGTGVVTVVGNALVDGLCGASPIKDDSALLTATGTKGAISGIADPFVGRVPPTFTCPASGANPTVGVSASASTIVVYPSAVTVSTDTVFQPGRFIFCKGLAITGGRITGTDVLFYVVTGTVDVQAAATVDLTGRSTSDANLLVWVAAANPQTVTIAGGPNVSSLRGLIYAPTSKLQLSTVVAANIGGVNVQGLKVTGAGQARFGLPLPLVTFSPSTLPAGLVGVSYPTTTLTAAGGTGPYVWSTPWTSTTGLPGGLNINAAGVISGTPTAAGTFTVTVTVFDSTKQAASTNYTITITSPVPVAVADSYTTAEDTPLSPAAPGVLANDTDAQGLPLTAILVSGVSHGTLTLSSNGSFTYTPSLNFNGADSFTYKANNGSFDSNVVTVSLTVTAVNDAPVNSVPGPQETPKDANKVFSAGNSNAITISDVDAGASTVQVTLTATNGTITLPVLTGLTFSAGDGTADATMTFTGTIANINLGLDGMTFAPAGGFSGAATLTIITNDLGKTGSGGALTDTDAVGIYVNPLGIFTGFVDIPSTGRPGSTSYSAGTYTVVAGKGTIGGTSDEFQIVYRSMTGDGRMTARVVSVVGNDAGAQAGVTFRETLAPGSVQATMDITKSNGWEFLDRQVTNGATTSSQGAGPVAPYWVRLTRVGNLVTAERSVDGVTWVGSTKTITMAPTIYIGLAVSSHNNSNNLTTATFDNVTVT